MTEETQSLDDVLEGTPLVEEAKSEPEAEANDDELKAPEVEETKGEEEAEPKAEDMDEGGAKPEAETPAAENEEEDKSWTKAMALDERKKRQALQAKVDRMEQQSPQSQVQEEQRPGVLEDEEGAFAHLEAKFEEKRLSDKIRLSSSLYSEIHEDYDEMKTVFIDLAQENPALIQQMNSSDNPAKFAYETAVNHTNVEKFSDPEYAEKLKNELRVQLLADLKGEKPGETDESKARKDAVKKVPDLTNTAAAGTSSPDQGDESLEGLTLGS